MMRADIPRRFDQRLPLLWDAHPPQGGARQALRSILDSARGIAGASASCVTVLREGVALEVLCPHGVNPQEFFDAFGAGGAASLVSVPFVQGLRQRGALCLFKLGAQPLSRLDLELLDCLAAQAELALAVEHQQSAIARLEAALRPADEEPLLIEDPQPLSEPALPAFLAAPRRPSPATT